MLSGNGESEILLRRFKNTKIILFILFCRFETLHFLLSGIFEEVFFFGRSFQHSSSVHR